MINRMLNKYKKSPFAKYSDGGTGTIVRVGVWVFTGRAGTGGSTGRYGSIRDGPVRGVRVGMGLYGTGR